MHPRFRSAESELREAPHNAASICEPLRSALGVDDAGVATYALPFSARMICASGEFAAAFGELQIDLGEGPAWDAFRSRKPVFRADVMREPRWQALAERMDGMQVRSVHAFPLVSGALDVGALCVSSQTDRDLDDDDLEAMTVLGPLAAKAIVARVMRATESEDNADAYSLREVHQATGMVAAQLHIRPDDALLAIRAHGFATGQPVRQIAREIIERRIDLSHE